MTEREQEIRVSLHADKMLRQALDIKDNNKLIAEMSDYKKEKIMFQINAKLRRKRIMFQIEEFEMGNITVYTLIKKIKEILNEG